MKKHCISKVFSLAMITSLTISTLTGCGSSPNTATSSPDENKDKPTTITIWSWDNGELVNKTYTAFHEKYPNYTIATTIVQRQDMEQKLQTALASGSDLPDIAWLENTYRGSLLSLGIWEDISKAPYNFDKSQLFDYLLPLETTSDGVYVGPEVPSVAGMAYKRPLAKEYLGTDDPAELQKIFTDWDAFIKKGVEVKEKSGGKIFMLAGLWDALSFFQGQSNTPFVIGDQLNLKKGFAPILQKLIDIKKAGIVDTLEQNSPALNASYADSTHIFYPCANWSVTYTIKANDKNGSGRWGFLIPPGGPFAMGGTIQAVPKAAKNKTAAVEFIKYRYQSEEGAKMLRDHQEYFAPFKPVYKNPTFYTKADSFFAGQDIQKTFAEQVLPNINTPRVATKYDQQINDGINLAIKTINGSTNNDLNVDSIITKMENELLNQAPKLKKD